MDLRPFMERWHMLPPSGGVMLVAVSGGRDSVCLLHYLAAMPRDFTVAAAHLNHGQRPTAGRDAAFVEELCRELEEKGIPYQSRVLELDMGQPFRSLEDAAVFFRTHSRDDPAELTPEVLQSRLQRRDDPEFPWYFPVNEPIGLLWFQACEIPDKEKER